MHCSPSLPSQWHPDFELDQAESSLHCERGVQWAADVMPGVESHFGIGPTLVRRSCFGNCQASIASSRRLCAEEVPSHKCCGPRTDAQKKGVAGHTFNRISPHRQIHRG